MSILIKGMEMPKNLGVSVTIYPDGRVIKYLGYGVKEQLGTAVPVPPHGELCDKTALIDKIGEHIDKAKDRSYDWWYACTVAYDFALAAPTIIPAEEGE